MSASDEVQLVDEQMPAQCRMHSYLNWAKEWIDKMDAVRHAMDEPLLSISDLSIGRAAFKDHRMPSQDQSA